MANNPYENYDRRNQQTFMQTCVTHESSDVYVRKYCRKEGPARRADMKNDVLPKQFVLDTFKNPSILENEADEIFVQTFNGPSRTKPELLVFEAGFTRENLNKILDSYYSVLGKKFYEIIRSTFGEKVENDFKQLSKNYINHLGNYIDSILASGKPAFFPNPAQLGRALDKATSPENLWNRNESLKTVCDLVGDSIEVCWALNMENSKGKEPLRKDPTIENGKNL